MTKNTKQNTYPCGFCSTGHHDRCPGGIVNGNLTEVVLCGCTEHPITPRCTDCGERGEGVNEDTWSCIDKIHCETRQSVRRERSLRELFGDTGPSHTTEPQKDAGTPKKPRRSTSGECLCCGEPTKGGKFLPGHDSKYLSEMVEKLVSGEYTLEQATTTMQESGCSEALITKLKKRVNK